jgi:hypothetical protein
MHRAIVEVVGRDAAPTRRWIERLLRSGDCPPIEPGSASWPEFELNGRYTNVASVVAWWREGSARRRAAANQRRADYYKSEATTVTTAGSTVPPGTPTAK